MKPRSLQPGDGPRLAQLDRDSTEDPWSDSLYAQVCAGDNPHRWGLLQEDSGGTLAGFVICEQAVDEGSILNLVVGPRWRRRGLGRSLLGTALAQMAATGVRYCHLDVRAGNTAALALYRSMGFAETGLRRGYYRRDDSSGDGPREDACLFSLDLSDEQ